jgi:hypothetical protein
VGIASIWLYKEKCEPIFLIVFRDSSLLSWLPWCKDGTQQCNKGGHLLANFSHGMSVPNRATWAATSSLAFLRPAPRSRSALCSRSAPLLTPLRPAPRLHSVPDIASRDRRRALRLIPPPRNTTRAAPCVLLPAPRLASRDCAAP